MKKCLRTCRGVFLAAVHEALCYYVARDMLIHHTNGKYLINRLKSYSTYTVKDVPTGTWIEVSIVGQNSFWSTPAPVFQCIYAFNSRTLTQRHTKMHTHMHAHTHIHTHTDVVDNKNLRNLVCTSLLPVYLVLSLTYIGQQTLLVIDWFHVICFTWSHMPLNSYLIRKIAKCGWTALCPLMLQLTFGNAFSLVKLLKSVIKRMKLLHGLSYALKLAVLKKWYSYMYTACTCRTKWH